LQPLILECLVPQQVVTYFDGPNSALPQLLHVINLMQLRDQRVLRPNFLILVGFSKIIELVHHALLGSLEKIFVLLIPRPISFSALSAPLRALS
jgi:hypothetical protein